MIPLKIIHCADGEPQACLGATRHSLRCEPTPAICGSPAWLPVAAAAGVNRTQIRRQSGVGCYAPRSRCTLVSPSGRGRKASASMPSLSPCWRRGSDNECRRTAKAAPAGGTRPMDAFTQWIESNTWCPARFFGGGENRPTRQDASARSDPLVRLCIRPLLAALLAARHGGSNPVIAPALARPRRRCRRTRLSAAARARGLVGVTGSPESDDRPPTPYHSAKRLMH